MSDLDGRNAAGSGQKAAGWVELRDERGKLRAKWDPGARVLEIGARGEVARWRVGADGNISLDQTRAG